MQDVADPLNQTLREHPGVGKALVFVSAPPRLGREALSVALAEISQHLVMRFVGGARRARGDGGFDVIGPQGETIEVKSRQVSNRPDLMFDFSGHAVDDAEAYCIAWDDTVSPPVICAAIRGSISEFIQRWGMEGQVGQSVRTSLKKAWRGIE